MGRVSRMMATTMVALVLAVALAGCASGGEAGSVSSSASASSASVSASASQQLAPGEYSAKFDTDSSMFHVNEANDGKGVLTVTDKGMSIHVPLVSKKIVKLYAGTASEAEADEAGAIEPTTDSVTYKDGTTEEVFGFDIPVPAIGEEFDVAILGEKGKWYDHKVSVSDPVSR